MGKNLNVPKRIGKEAGERIETTVLKRRKRIEEVHADKVRKGREQEKAAGQRRKLRQQVFRNARDYVNNFKRREHQKKEVARRQRHQLKAPVAVPRSAEGSMAFAIRVKGDDIPETCKRYLRKWRLGKMYDGIFITVNEESLKTLHLLKDYVKWGYPTPEQIRSLIRTRGYTFNDSGVRVPISGNQVIEDRLGEHNVLCVEDMEHAIATHSPVFQKVVDFLAPFRLEPPAKDQGEMERRARERKTEAGDKTFAAFLLGCMHDVPSAAQPPSAPKAASLLAAASQPKKKAKKKKKTSA